MSKYVKRCNECRNVRGVTSYRVQEGGGRVDVCRWCEERTGNAVRAVKMQHKRVRKLIQEEALLTARLTRIRRELARARGEVAASAPVAPTLTELAS